MRVAIVQRVFPHYRLSFMRKLREKLESHAIDLRLVYGQERPATVPKSVDLADSWATKIKNQYIDTPVGELVWQPCLSYLQNVDLLIVEQANRLLVNYPLQFFWRNRKRKLAFWGHGANFQAQNKSGFKEKLKASFVGKVDWWFAYTGSSAALVRSAGYPSERITVVNNSIDTEGLETAMRSVTPEQKLSIRERLGLGEGPVALYCGGMYPEKQLSFLLDAAKQLRKIVPDFNIILIGSGPDEDLVVEEAAKHSWIHYPGAVYGAERAVYFSLSNLMMMPALVGLAIVDSFVAGVPLFTTDIPVHGPEIFYLENEQNGIMTPFDLAQYVDGVAKYLRDKEQMTTLVKGCAESASRYTLDAMVENFATGVSAVLDGAAD